MIDFIKSIIPNIIYGIAITLEIIAKGILLCAVSLASVSVSLHILLKTKKGKKYSIIEEKVKEVVGYITALQKLQKNTNQIDDSSKLVDALKNTQEDEENQKQQNVNVITLGKKKNDPTEPKS